jgi:membrane protein implicated in regulation of membrane protease activity
MKRTDTTIIAGIALMAAGALFLFENLGFLGPLQNSVWALLFGAGGIVFLTTFWRDRARWWALIPGFTLLSLGALIGLQPARERQVNDDRRKNRSDAEHRGSDLRPLRRNARPADLSRAGDPIAGGAEHL